MRKEQARHQDRVDLVMGSLRDGRRGIDQYFKQLRSEGNHGSARGRDQVEGYDRVCAHRTRGGSRRGRLAAATDRAADLRQRQSRYVVETEPWPVGIFGALIR